MLVTELNQKQFNHLRELYYNTMVEEDNDKVVGITEPEQICDSVIHNYYEGMQFVEGDFIY